MTEALRALWDEPRAPGAPARVWRDWALAGILVPLTVLEGLLRPDLPMRALSVVVLVVLAPVLLWRRRQPFAAVALAFGVTGLLPVFTGQALENDATALVLITVYALARWGAGREIVAGVAVVAAKFAVAVWLGEVDAGDAVAGPAVLSACLALGVALRYRASARRREVDRIRLLERERLARDLHDTVAHHVSAMAIRAQAGIATAALHPDAATDALHVIEAEASRALAEMRAMVRVLRRDGLPEPAELTPNPHTAGPAPDPPDPRIADLVGLAGRAGARTGPGVHVGLSGDLGDLPPEVGAAIYRLAQESVTNARRHARHATRIEVRVDADDTSVRLRVSDDGDHSLSHAAATPGFGLIGMAERADLLGGTVEAGPGAGRGWTVTAVLPRAESPA
ncbi:sensor histidine kinase [Dactylosporangium siamense]|uniref:histidine kinase n=1 Tax=Dactylosporangium siamense TaxID=685454 RepID=A0A919UCB7_9ACTN|nr:histidine kinase [Dactylosporangium siamense]GIG50187.1 two-component sensor histidine kinase [Dactylosporangium siamense]